MHATTEQLLSLRDGQPVAAGTAAHVAGCESCGIQLRSLERTRSRLREMPALDPPRDLWRTVAIHAVGKPARPAGRGRYLFAAAASLALGALLVLHIVQQPEQGPAPGTTTDLIASTPAPASSVNGASRAELLATSRQLEAALRALPAAPRVTRASTALTIAELQDRIYEIDLLLSDPRLSPADERSLWQQRVTLMDALMQIRFAQLAEAR